MTVRFRITTKPLNRIRSMLLHTAIVELPTLIRRNMTVAIQDYNKAIELDPNYVNAYISRGLAYSNQEEYDRAIQDYNKGH